MTYFMIVMTLVIGGERFDSYGPCTEGGKDKAIAILGYYDSLSADAGGPLDMDGLYADFQACEAP